MRDAWKYEVGGDTRSSSVKKAAVRARTGEAGADCAAIY